LTEEELRQWQKTTEWISLALYLRLLFDISLTTCCQTNIRLILIPRLATKKIHLILRHDSHEFVWNKSRNELKAEYRPEPFWDFYNEFITHIISFLLLLFLGCSISINSTFQCLVSPLLLFDKAKYKKISIYAAIVFFAASETKPLASKMSVEDMTTSKSFNQLFKYVFPFQVSCVFKTTRISIIWWKTHFKRLKQINSFGQLKDGQNLNICIKESRPNSHCELFA